MLGILVGKLELNPIEENNLDIAQARLRIYSVTLIKKITLAANVFVNFYLGISFHTQL